MCHLYPFLKKKASLATISIALLSSVITSAQTSACGPVVENFNNTGGSMAGFTSSTLNSTAPGFTYGQNGSNGYLQRCGVSSGGTVFEMSTPTFQTSPSQTTVGYGFELSGAVVVSGINVFLQYIDNSNNINSVSVAYFSPSYSGTGSAAVAAECRAFNINSYNGFTPGDRYRFIFQFTASSSSEAGECILFDNFRTTGAASQIVLPVSFTNFVAKKTTTGAELIWNVAGEKEVSFYEVERSSNGRDFIKVGEVTATGNSAYKFVDKTSITGVNYYRVRNVDIDGKFKYTAIVKINFSNAVLINIYPQPANNEITIDHGSSTAGNISITSAYGQLIKSIKTTEGANRSKISIGSLQAGLYLITYNDGEGNLQTLKLIKQ